MVAVALIIGRVLLTTSPAPRTGQCLGLHRLPGCTTAMGGKVEVQVSVRQQYNHRHLLSVNETGSNHLLVVYVCSLTN